MGPGARGLHGATAAGRVVVVCHLPVVTATVPGQPLGPSPNSEVTLNVHHPYLISLHCLLLLPGPPLGASTVWERDGGTDPATLM